MKLKELQSSFSNYCLHEKNDEFLNELAGDKKLKSSRIKIYHGNIFGSILECLSVTFSSLKKLVGDESFESICANFAKQNPPTHGDLNMYGENLHEFLSEQIALAKHPYLADIAKFEWAWNQVYNARDDEPQTHEQILSLNYPADEIWVALETSEGKKLEDIDMRPQKIKIKIWREKLDIYFKRI